MINGLSIIPLLFISMYYGIKYTSDKLENKDN